MLLFLAQFKWDLAAPFLVVVAGGSLTLLLINQALTFYRQHMKEDPAPADTYATKADHGALTRRVELCATKEQHTELRGRVDRISEDIRSGFEKLDGKRSQSVAGLHDDLRDAIDALRAEVKQDNKGVHDRINEILEAVSELRGRIIR